MFTYFVYSPILFCDQKLIMMHQPPLVKTKAVPHRASTTTVCLGRADPE